MSLYESVVIARQDISSAQVDALMDKLTEVLVAGGGEVKKREAWGLRNLSYRINKNRKGHYVLLNIDAPAAAVAEYERQMRINEDVLRYMTVRVEALEEGPSAMMQPRNERGDRGDRGPRGDRGDRGDRGGRRFERDRAPAPQPAAEGE
ncbi:30S ribosomal protein S6 [uncultured Alphaproteobacteria bacterium]|uniref:Small ribosomal subunit protein bS6 n=1 Tax=uncultured Alphaproteobacteria bacterium TaxID=91750 RepID=A0A212KLE7_9PROT|nr:30S ribosomal protein S6 [uncultured Alphaproteobacteria bacterium]